jgi:hypothetical protein
MGYAGLGISDGGYISASKNHANVASTDLNQYACNKCLANHTMVRFDDQGEVVWIASLRDEELFPVPRYPEDYEDYEQASTYPRSMAPGTNGTFIIVGQRTLGDDTDRSEIAVTYIASFRDPSLIGLEQATPEPFIPAALLLLPLCGAWRRTQRTR